MPSRGVQKSFTPSTLESLHRMHKLVWKTKNSQWASGNSGLRSGWSNPDNHSLHLWRAEKHLRKHTTPKHEVYSLDVQTITLTEAVALHLRGVMHCTADTWLADWMSEQVYRCWYETAFRKKNYNKMISALQHVPWCWAGAKGYEDAGAAGWHCHLVVQKKTACL